MVTGQTARLTARGLVALVLFFSVLFGTWAICSRVDTTMAAVSSGDTLPADIVNQVYGVRYENVGRECVSFRLYGRTAGALELAIAYVRPFELYVNGKNIYSFRDEDVYARIHTIALSGRETSGAEGMLVELHSADMGFGRDRLKIAIGSPELIQRNLFQANYLYFFIIGVCSMIMITCLVLVLKKRSEASYLITLFVYAGVTVLAAFFALNDTRLNITYAACQAYHIYMTSLLDISGAFACALIPLQCMCFSSPENRKLYIKWTLVPCIVYSLLLLVLTLFNMGVTLRGFFRYFYYIGLPALIAAYVMRDRGSLGMLLAYALIRGLGSYSNDAATAGAVTLFVKFSLFDTLPFMLTCMAVVYSRFAMKYQESEILNAELSEMSVSLDKRVKECTAELENDNARLIETERRRHAMMTNIFHDIRNPIFSIKGCLEMMTPESEHDKRLKAVSEKRLGLLRELTENLFLVSKLEEKEVEFSESAQDIGELCESAIAPATVAGQEKGIDVSSRIEGGQLVSGDSFWLGRMLENLLENALKYTPKGGSVTLRAAGRGNTATIEIEDTGKGIAPEELPYIFERYYHGKLEDKGKSSGLGLSIAKEIAVQHGGNITVRSELGKGTVFTVTLPLLHAPENAASAKS